MVVYHIIVGNYHSQSIRTVFLFREINENSILRLHEINTDDKIFFEPPVCTHEDCLAE